MPIPPITKKKNPPCHQKKKICSELRDPHAGEFAPAQQGEAITKYDPKNGNVKRTGVDTPAHRDSALLSPAAVVNWTGGKVPRSLERGRLLSTQEINMELADFCLVQNGLHMRI
jgi:hypothetical protein